MMLAGLRRLRFWWLGGALWVAPALAQAAMYTADVRWQPSSGAGVVGYRVYTRTLVGTYGAPLDARMPTLAADGTMTFPVGGLDPSAGHAFSVTAYASDGTESALSNELTLPVQTSTTSTTATSSTSTTSTTRPRPTTSTSSTSSSTTTTRPPTTSTTRPTTVTSTSSSTTSTRTTSSTTTTTVLGCTSGSQCNDDNPCTTDTCSAGVCQHTEVASGTSCGDGNVCDGLKTCQAGICQAGTPMNCSDGNPCTVDSCDPATGCTHVALPDGTTCGGHGPCKARQMCLGGVCQAAAADGTGADVVNDEPEKLEITKFVARPHGRSRVRLSVKARFLPTTPVEPDRTGMTIEVDDASGSPLYSASVPAEMFTANYIRTRFLYVADGTAPASYADVRMLKVMTGGNSVVVRAKAILPASVLASPALVSDPVRSDPASRGFAWAIRWGRGCVSNPVSCAGHKKCRPM